MLFSLNLFLCLIIYQPYVDLVKLHVLIHTINSLYPPASTKLKGEYTGITLSVCPSVPIWRRQERRSKYSVQLASWELRSNSPKMSVCLSVDRIVSALYLQQYSLDPFHICTSHQATSEGVSSVMSISKFKILKFWRILKFCNFDFVFFWLGIQYDSMVWVIMRWRWVSSESRH